MVADVYAHTGGVRAFRVPPESSTVERIRDRFNNWIVQRPVFSGFTEFRNLISQHPRHTQKQISLELCEFARMGYRVPKISQHTQKHPKPLPIPKDRLELCPFF